MKTKKTICKGNLPPQQRQKGVIAVVVAIGIAALIGVVGLALDTGHLLLNKTRLQNAVDAAALSGAKTLQQSISADPMLDARDAAIASFTANLSTELKGTAIPVPDVTFSEDRSPGSFVAATANPPNFVKVASPAISLTSFLIKAVGFDNKKVAATAVAGFGLGIQVCDMIPVMVCAGEDTSEGNYNGYKLFNPSTYTTADNITLKMGSGDGPDGDVGTGSFHLIDLPGLQGGNDIRYAFAGSPSCGTQSENTEVNLAPGNKVGALVQGVNTRFGDYAGPLQGQETTYPADYANKEASSNCDGVPYDNENVNADGTIDYDYDSGTGSTACLDPVNYYRAYSEHSSWTKGISGPTLDSYQRRIVTVPIGDCSVTASGSATIPTLGFGCFLLTALAQQTGGASSSSGSLEGVFIEDCIPPAEGVSEDSGAIIILLYQNPDGVDS